MATESKGKAATRRTIREKLDNGTLPPYPGASLPTRTSSWPADVTPPNFTAVGHLTSPCPGCERSDGYGSTYPTPSGPVNFHQECAEIWEEESQRPRPSS
jgi:hypothetical protein